MNIEELHKLLEELLALPKENEWVEFKANNANPEEIGENISALSNSSCLYGKSNGYLVFGVEDKTLRVVGTSFKPLTKKKGGEELEHWLST